MSAPQLEQYPGYYPAGSRPFWSRLKVGVAAGVAGLIVGIAGGGSDAEPAAGADGEANLSEVRADLAQALQEKDDAVEERSDLSDQLQEQREEAAAQSVVAKKAANAAQKKAVKAAVAKVRQEERKKAAAAVAAAKRQAAAATAPAVAPLAAAPPSTDPRFSYCYEANAAGYGPYYQGQDPEYDWYDDRDGDGMVCE